MPVIYVYLSKKAGDVTPKGRTYIKHGAERAEERGFSSEQIDNIIDNNQKSKTKQIDPMSGEQTWRYQDKRGNTVFTDEHSQCIITVYSHPKNINDTKYISKSR
ncbi:TPA: hypothetical protein U2K68_001603 [Providencia stuartii]|nr:hypothetical protein [Providencia stuartii]HEM7165956.1 hypothetical protein [Providencia stuartii]